MGHAEENKKEYIKQYKSILNSNIFVQGIFNGDYNIIANTLGYKNSQELAIDQSKTYSEHKHNPFLIPDMEKVCNVIYNHIKKQSKMLVFGDFDVDGISAATVMLKGLQYLGAEKLDVLIPNREVGYSIKKEYIIEYLKNEVKPDLIITVDCGIKSAKDIEYIVKELGIEVVVTDHHGVDHDNMALYASAIVNPHRNDSKYPFQEISGSLVSLKVIEALKLYIEEVIQTTAFITGPNGNPNSVLPELEEIATLGTISDVMPIINENRWLVKDTLARYPMSKNIGIASFTHNLRKEYDKTGKGEINTDFVGWQIGPRINASGRIANPYLGLLMFFANDKGEADNIFKQLDDVNKERQKVLKDDFEEAYNFMFPIQENYKALVYVDEGILDGIIGLIAGRLKEEFFKPAIAIGALNENTNVLKGSCRSVPGFDITNSLDILDKEYLKKTGKNLLVGFGGHPMAAGFGIHKDNVDIFLKMFDDYTRKVITDDMLSRVKYVNIEINDFLLLKPILVDNIYSMGPYGNRNEMPTVLLKGNILSISVIGKTGNTVKLSLKDKQGNLVDCILFRYKNNKYMKDFIDNCIEYGYNKELGIIGVLNKNEFNGKTTVQLQIQDIIIL